jgi:riboflavin kinase / FMN adenylyltransferase
MQLVRTAAELSPRPRKVCVAIGFFDGVHLGHQQILRQTVQDAGQHEATAVVVTFDQHPSTVVAPERTPPLIYSTAQRTRAIAALGTEVLWLIRFDQAFSQRSGEAFVRELVQGFGPVCSICVGANFSFGHQRSGNVTLLRTLGKELGFAVHGLAAVSLDGQTISSTRVREAIRLGELDAASQMLGRAYSLAGVVTRGDQVGRQLGFPTANLEVTGRALPPHGVYAVHARTADGRSHRAVMNLGLRPTLARPDPHLQAEVHLLEFTGDLYGQELEVAFAEKLRDEQRFASPEDLRRQIALDITAARRLFE